MNERAINICLLNILKEYSDKDHIMPMKEIIDKMGLVYDLHIDRRTVYSGVELLNNLGYDIETYSENKKGYYLRTRDFDISEVRLLMDAVYSFKYISPKQTKELIEKLQQTLSINERKQYKNLTVVRNEYKSQNQETFLNIEILDEAIQKKRKVAFIYENYGLDKKLKPRSEKKVIVSPYGMVCDHSFYYLVNIRDGFIEPSMYRIDYMKDIEILPDKVLLSAKEAKLDSLDKVSYAFFRKPVKVKLLGQSSALRHVIDEFGNNTKITPNDDETFIAEFEATPNGAAIWVLQFIDSVKILEPKEVIDEIKRKLKGNQYS